MKRVRISWLLGSGGRGELPVCHFGQLPSPNKLLEEHDLYTKHQQGRHSVTLVAQSLGGGSRAWNVAQAVTQLSVFISFTNSVSILLNLHVAPNLFMRD